MSSIIGRANLLLTTSIGGGVHAGIKGPAISRKSLKFAALLDLNQRPSDYEFGKIYITIIPFP